MFQNRCGSSLIIRLFYSYRMFVIYILTILHRLFAYISYIIYETSTISFCTPQRKSEKETSQLAVGSYCCCEVVRSRPVSSVICYTFCRHHRSGVLQVAHLFIVGHQEVVPDLVNIKRLQFS